VALANAKAGLTSLAPWGREEAVSTQARGRAFDELATEMASGTLSRGRMLRLMGAALVGGTLGSLGGIAAADPCKPNGKVCKKNSQCCSGICEGGTCSACPSGYTQLSNGTCAKPCNNSVDCTAVGCGGCIFEVGGGGASYCRGSSIISLSTCTSNADCDPGQFCATQDNTGSGRRTCFTAC
jgi:hypothetical protein